MNSSGKMSGSLMYDFALDMVCFECVQDRQHLEFDTLNTVPSRLLSLIY